MFVALLRAIAALSLPPLRRAVATSLALTIASFIVLWIGLGAGLDRANAIAWAPLHWLLNLFGALSVLVLSWLLFPAAATLVMSFFLGRIADAVEAVHYPGRGPARPQPFSELLGITLRLMLVTIVLNLLALPIYIFLPGINLFVFLLLNGYLFGREYFEVVALRRLDRDAAAALRHRFAARVFVGGVVIAGLFAVPLVNLLAPAIATAFMLHVFEGLRRLEPVPRSC